MKNYEIFLSATDSKIEDKSRFRIDLYGNMKIKDVKELKCFIILYYSQGHQDNISLKGKIVNRKVRYIQVFKK